MVKATSRPRSIAMTWHHCQFVVRKHLNKTLKAMETSLLELLPEGYSQSSTLFSASH